MHFMLYMRLAGATGLEPAQNTVLETAALPIELHPYEYFLV